MTPSETRYRWGYEDGRRGKTIRPDMIEELTEKYPEFIEGWLEGVRALEAAENGAPAGDARW
jgi:hypothetical protein